VQWLDPWGLCDAGDGGCHSNSDSDGSGDGSWPGPPGPSPRDPSDYPDDPYGVCEPEPDPYTPDKSCTDMYEECEEKDSPGCTDSYPGKCNVYGESCCETCRSQCQNGQTYHRKCKKCGFTE
jgi:hypothetical protein